MLIAAEQDARAPAGGDAARHERSGMERDRVVDLDDGPVREDSIFGECAELTVSHQVFVAEMPATGSVGRHLP